MKCPFCQQELHDDKDGYFSCYTDNCSGGPNLSATKELWHNIKLMKKQLDVAKKALFHTNEFLYGRYKATGWDIQQELKYAHTVVNKDIK